MTSAGDALRAAILADPDDDTARLVYADWLEENGRADRAAFVRAQVEAARAEPHGPQARAAALRANALLNRPNNWKAWTDAVRDRVLDLRFERGFVEHVDAEPGAFLHAAEDVFAEHPVRSLRLVPHSNPEYRTGLAPVFDLACLRRLRRLAFAPRTEFLYDDYGALEASPHLAGLTDLTLAGCPLHLSWLEDLLRGEQFPALAGLDVSDVTHAGPTVAVAVAQADHRELRRLDVSRVAFTSEHLLQILHARCLRRVEELRLGWAALRADDHGPLYHLNIGWVLPWERLTLLDLTGQRLGDEGVKEIVAKREASPLRWLGLADNWLTPEGVRMLVAAKHLSLHHLDVRRNNLAPSHLAALRERFPDAVVLG